MKSKSVAKKRKTKKGDKTGEKTDEKPRLPKQFYDDGLGDILDWIDTEVLSHSELKKLKERGKNDESNGPKSAKRLKKSTRLYGENEVDLNIFPRRVKFQPTADDPEISVDKAITDRVRGLMNRLTAQTMGFVTSEFEKLYSSHPRQSINVAIFNTIESSVICSSTLTKRKLVAELMLLTSYLSHSISNNIGATLVHRLIKKFNELYMIELDSSDVYRDDPDKRLENILCCLANLYVIGLVSANIIFEVAKKINDGLFRPKSVELLLFILKSVGFQLRKEPTQMRQLILRTQDNCKELEKACGLISRIQFMIDALTAIKNNNVNKLENYGCDVDSGTIETTLKGLIRRTKLPESLNDATYEEILNSSNWYLLDTRLDDELKASDDGELSRQTVRKANVSEREEQICRALNLNRPAEKTIFSALSKASDYIEGCNIILGFGLDHCSEAMRVCVHAAIHGKKYNPFYFNVINNLSKYNRRYKMAAKFAIQDIIRALSNLSQPRVELFQKLTLELVLENAVPITILKSVEWANINQSSKSYLVSLFEQISELPDEKKRVIMSKVDKKGSFATAMRTFCNCFLKGCHLFK